jgi:hypothetical protein
MSASGFSPTQTGLWALLHGDNTLMQMVDGIFDSIPAGAQTKYIVLGAATEVPFNTFGKSVALVSARGHEDVFTIHVWTQDQADGAGTKSAQLIIDKITELVEAALFPIAGHTTVMAQLEYSEVMESFDEDTNKLWRHGVARYRIISQDSA